LALEGGNWSSLRLSYVLHEKKSIGYELVRMRPRPNFHASWNLTTFPLPRSPVTVRNTKDIYNFFTFWTATQLRPLRETETWSMNWFPAFSRAEGETCGFAVQ
jgi:hypothetical protein